MIFASYLNCLPPNNKNIEKSEILYKFAAGVQSSGDNVILHREQTTIDADVAMMVGWVHEGSKNSPHLKFRQQILNYQKFKNKRTLIADSNLFLYKDSTNPHHYLRYSFDGVFPNTGIYCDTEIDPTRWIKLSNRIGINVKEYRSSGDHILLLLQRNGGWSMAGYDVVDWTAATIRELRKYTDRTIIIRAHPGDKGSSKYLTADNLIKKIGLLKNVRVSPEGKDLIDDLKNCWAAVNYNSSPTVGAAIEGVPIFVTDPARSQCVDVANLNLADIESPVLHDRQRWLERLSMFHWSFDEIQSGEAWRHMRKYV